LSPAERDLALDRHAKRAVQAKTAFVELKDELVTIMEDEKLSWTRRFNAYNLLSRCLVRLDLDLTPRDIEVLVKELTNERPKWQAAAFYYTQEWI